MRILKPARLRPGDVIGLIAPSSPVRPLEKIERGARYLEKLGYRVKIGKHTEKEEGYLAGTDEERAQDLNAMLRDPQVRAIIALRGGYGCPRLLPLVDYRAVRRDPKILVGFSDLTALQMALFRKAGLITFSGPMAGVELWQTPDPYTEEHFWRVLTSPRKIGLLPNPADAPLRTLRPGRAQGRLLGGNLSLVISALATPYSPSYREAMLVLEEVDEFPHRVDRMFTQLRNAGILGGINGLVLGQFTQCQPREPLKPHLSVEQIVRQVVQWVPTPCVENLQYGHIPKKLTLPWGLQAKLDSRRNQLSIPEAGVV